jgi:hypothetical protein
LWHFGHTIGFAFLRATHSCWQRQQSQPGSIFFGIF